MKYKWYCLTPYEDEHVQGFPQIFRFNLKVFSVQNSKKKLRELKNFLMNEKISQIRLLCFY